MSIINMFLCYFSSWTSLLQDVSLELFESFHLLLHDKQHSIVYRVHCISKPCYHKYQINFYNFVKDYFFSCKLSKIQENTGVFQCTLDLDGIFAPIFVYSDFIMYMLCNNPLETHMLFHSTLILGPKNAIFDFF